MAPDDPTPAWRDRVAAAWAAGRGRAAAVLARVGDVGRRQVTPRRVGAWLLVGLAVVLPCAAWGVTTASAQGSLGPHTARYEVTVDGEVTVDLGPLGTIVIDSPLPVGLGARVVVQEIPEDVTSIDAATSIESLVPALEQYVAFFTGPEATVALAVRALVADAVQRTLLAVLAVTLALLGLRALLGVRRRAELAARFRPYRTATAGAAAIVVLVVGGITASDPLPSAPADARRASSVFDDTPLEGARITGRLAGVVDTYGGYAVDAWRENERFYAAAEEAVRAAWADRVEADQRLLDPRRATGRPVPPVRTPTPGDGESGTEEPEKAEAPELVTALVVSDLHCNIGMARVIGAVAELSGAALVLNAGDTTVNGTVVESYCVQTFADALPDGVVTVVANGNHDSEDTAEQERAAGWVVLEGEVVEAAGLRILGDADPRATRIGAGTTLIGDESLADVADRLADVACRDDDGVDLLLVHDQMVGVPALVAGCVPAQVSGHYHRREGPVRSGLGTRYTSSSTAGARLGQPTVGPLSATAELTVLRFDPESRRISDYRLVLVRPDATAVVTVPLRWPHQSPRLTPDPPLQ
jgi:hypothetical protein